MLQELKRVRDIAVQIRSTYQETYGTLRWIWDEVFSAIGRKYVVRAILVQTVVTFLAMGVTYIAKDVIDAVAEGRKGDALVLVLIGIAGTMVTARLFAGYQEMTRELAWNNNSKSIRVSLTELFFLRTAGEMTSEDNEVGAEQVESAHDRVQNILYMLLFEGPIVVIGMFTATVLVATVDVVAGLVLLALIVVNICWFLVCNSILSVRLEKIDEDFRRANRRMIEKWTFGLSTKSNGVEDKVVSMVSDEISGPLYEDKRVWVYWFIPVDLIRGHINIAIVVTILCYGLVVGEWSSGEFGAMFFWLMSCTEKFGYVGHIMRHLTEQMVRIRAVREGLCSKPAFLHNVGIIYQPTITKGREDGTGA